MDDSTSSPAFFRLFFNEELYRITGSELTDSHIKQVPGAVSEELVAYGGPSVIDGVNQRTLLLLNYPGNGMLPAGDKLLLEQVLRAIGLGLTDVAKLNTALTDVAYSWEDIARQSKSDFVIAFGVNPKYLPAGIQEGQIYNIDGKRVLCSATLSELIANNMRKKLLWQGMKEIYGI